MNLFLVFALDAAAAGEADAAGCVWVQIAAEGVFKGHEAGEFELNEKLFTQVVKNFRGHPAYAKGAADVIPWDFHHKSEHDSPEIGTQGAPAQGWVRELEVRKSDAGVELWALTRWLDLAKQYIQGEQYRWASVALHSDVKHPVSGENIGWWLSSVALTNDPFIQGMQPLVATRTGRGHVLMAPGGRLELSNTPDYIISELRYMFSLSETDGLDVCAAELAKLKGYIAAGVAPAGVDVAKLIHRLRCMLSLPLLTEDAEVLAQADVLIAKLTAESAATITTETPRKDTMSKLIQLAAAARLRAVTTEDDAAQVILAELKEGADAKAICEALFEAIGVEDKDGALKQIVDLMSKAKKLEEAMPQLAQLKAGTAKAEEEQEKKDVEEVMAHHKLSPSAKPALLSMRRGSVKLSTDMSDADWVKALEAKKKAREDFLKEYPLPAPSQAHLTQSISGSVAGSHTSPVLRSLTAGAGGVHFGAPTVSDAPLTADGSHLTLEQLAEYEGRNVTEKAMAYVRANGGKDLTLDACHERASKLIRRLRAA